MECYQPQITEYLYDDALRHVFLCCSGSALAFARQTCKKFAEMIPPQTIKLSEVAVSLSTVVWVHWMYGLDDFGLVSCYAGYYKNRELSAWLERGGVLSGDDEQSGAACGGHLEYFSKIFKKGANNDCLVAITSLGAPTIKGKWGDPCHVAKCRILKATLSLNCPVYPEDLYAVFLTRYIQLGGTLDYRGYYEAAMQSATTLLNILFRADCPNGHYNPRELCYAPDPVRSWFDDRLLSDVLKTNQNVSTMDWLYNNGWPLWDIDWTRHVKSVEAFQWLWGHVILDHAPVNGYHKIVAPINGYPDELDKWLNGNGYIQMVLKPLIFDND